MFVTEIPEQIFSQGSGNCVFLPKPRRIHLVIFARVEMKVDYLRLCSRASDNPGFIWFSDFTCIRSSRWVLGGSLEAGVFKLRALLGERTPKNHSAVKKDIPES